MPSETSEGPTVEIRPKLPKILAGVKAKDEIAKILTSSDPLEEMERLGNFAVSHKRMMNLKKAMVESDDPEEK